MKIVLVSSTAPFVKGGARNIVEWLRIEMLRRGHQVEIIEIPEYDEPSKIIQQSYGLRFLNLDKADKVITFRPQSHLIQHHNKTVWFIHHLRVFYDLWESSYRDFPADDKHVGIRDELQRIDTLALQQAKNVFSNSITMQSRLLKYNGIRSEVLYPPVINAEEYKNISFEKKLVYVSRLEHHKRQHLIIEAMNWIPRDFKLTIAGKSGNESYIKYLNTIVAKYSLEDRISIEDRWISEDEKRQLLGTSLYNVYMPLEEDSYGYPTLEAAHAGKATITTSDSGGVKEFVTHDKNGLVFQPNPESIGNGIRKYLSIDDARKLGENAYKTISDLAINWDFVIESLLR